MKTLDGYIEFVLGYDLSTIDDKMDRVKLRLGLQFFDRVRQAYNENLMYNGRSAIALVDSLNLKPIDDIKSNKIKFLLDLLETITHKDHPLLVLMFFGTDHIKTDIQKKIKYWD